MPYLGQLYATHNNIESLNEEWFNKYVQQQQQQQQQQHIIIIINFSYSP
jgi:hypothetical protein